jgi:predicted 3-demethylubiquinone-9 3-methyltransferase (glyoxalase superfamily)
LIAGQSGGACRIVGAADVLLGEAKEDAMRKITPFLWFDNQAEEAARFYVSLFRNSKITSIARFNGASPGPIGEAMVVTFELDGVEYAAMNGGPYQKLDEAFSMQIICDTQEEIDAFWDKLSEGGQTNVCGWLKDRYGLSWQVTPKVLMDLISGSDPAKAKRAMEAMMKMTKLDIAEIEAAAAG